MSIPSTPSTLAVPTMRHSGYFIHEADLTIRVDRYVFRVHRFFLERESAYFRLRLEKSSHPERNPPGSSESNPLVLDDATSEAFARFLWVFYNPKYSVYNATPEEWSSILELAQKWGFRHVEELCIRELERLALSPVDRIHIYQQHNLDKTLLLDSFESLTTREEPIGVEEGMKLGLQTSVQIAMAREKSRGPDTGLRSPDVQLDSPHIRGLLSDIFRIETNGAAYAGPFTAPLNDSGKLDRASALPATAPAKRSTSASEANPPTNDISNQKPTQEASRRTQRVRNNSNRPLI